VFVLIIGGGKVGLNTARQLLQLGHEIALVEQRKTRFDLIYPELEDSLVFGDGTEIWVLEKAGIGRADMVVAVTGDDEDNIIISQISKLKFGVPKVVARVNNPFNQPTFDLLGVEATVCAATSMLRMILHELPVHKFVHLLSLPSNTFLSKLKPRGEMIRADLEKMMETAESEAELKIGVQKADEFTWKQRLDMDTCISCGRCEEICPAYMANKETFTPRQLIARLKKSVHDIKELQENRSLGSPAAAVGAEAAQLADIVGSAFDEEFIWHCRTCTACMEVCPGLIEHVDTLMEIRRNEVLIQGRMPPDAARALKMLESLGNPFGPQSDRVDWVDELGVRVVGPGEKCDVIYWIGCCATFDPQKQKIAKDLCKLMERCGIDFGVLGADEKCCGDPARVIGQELLFQQIAKETVALLKSRDFKVLMTSCPHCYNVLKNEYKQFGGDFNVVHHSEFLHEMVWNGTLVPKFGADRKYVYHDPCYLGRYQKIYDSPREVIKSIPKAHVLEMKNHHAKSMCCGGGGGHYWMDLKKGERINNLRVKQAHDSGADTIVTGCAYCLHMLEDSVKLLNHDDTIRVIDLASLMLESLEEKKKNKVSSEDVKPA